MVDIVANEHALNGPLEIRVMFSLVIGRGSDHAGFAEAVAGDVSRCFFDVAPPIASENSAYLRRTTQHLRVLGNQIAETLRFRERSIRPRQNATVNSVDALNVA